MSLREVILYPITGLYDECHDTDYDSLMNPNYPDHGNLLHSLRNINNKWWSEATSEDVLKEIIQRVSDKYRYTPELMGVHHSLLLKDPEIFYQAVRNSLLGLSNLGSSYIDYFSHLETLHIFCNLYTEVISSRHKLNLQEGFEVNELSASHLLQISLNEKENPYLGFLRNNFESLLEDLSPEFLWISGRIKLSTITMAIIAKQYNANLHVSVTYHSSEYYSLNKISRYLAKNESLFKIIDSIVLDDFENTMPQLIECLEGGHSLSTVPNLLYKDERGIISSTPSLAAKRSIQCNTYKHRKQPNNSSITTQSNLIDVKLWPSSKCYWNNCSFCGINQKYITLPPNNFTNLNELEVFFGNLAKNSGIKYLWSIDEAIPPYSLASIAKLIVSNDLDINWQARSKIDKGFTKDICSLLAKSGLTEIRLGLESSCPRILKLMDKFTSDWSLELVEEIVRNFDSCGISVHFPMIIGFPSETDKERRETYEFLRKIKETYRGVTFNINILGLDVASALYKNFEDYGITSIKWPAPANDFLGNLVDWDSTENMRSYQELDVERNCFMRDVLYPWMPITASIPVYIYYRLTETSRLTLFVKSDTEKSQAAIIPSSPDKNTVISRSSKLVYWASEDDVITYYDWSTHHIFECDTAFSKFIERINGVNTIKDNVKCAFDYADDGDVEDYLTEVLPKVTELMQMGVVF